MKNIVLMGLPASGKSTYRNQLIADFPENTFLVYSTDDYIETVAQNEDSTYEKVFKSTIKSAETIQKKKLQTNLTLHEPKPVLWDQTNLSSRKRRNVLRMLNEFRDHDVEVENTLVFIKSTLQKCYINNRSRSRGAMKESLIYNMFQDLTPPSYDEKSKDEHESTWDRILIVENGNVYFLPKS